MSCQERLEACSELTWNVTTVRKTALFLYVAGLFPIVSLLSH